MRDPKRIKLILDKIEQIWTKSPDMRLMQLLSNVLYGANKSKRSYNRDDVLKKGGYSDSNTPEIKFVQFIDDMINDANKGVSEDYFYLEDNKLLEQLEKWESNSAIN